MKIKDRDDVIRWSSVCFNTASRDTNLKPGKGQVQRMGRGGGGGGGGGGKITICNQRGAQ